jgi:hypothetical protein
MFAIALTSCETVQDNPSTGFDPSLKDVTIQSGDTLEPIYKQLAATTNDIVIEIPAGVDTVYTGKIELTPGQTFTLVGSEKNPPVVVPTASMKFANTFTIKNVIFDCSNFDSHLLMMIKEPDENLAVESTDPTPTILYVIKTPVVIENVIAKGLTKAFFYDNGQKYVFDSFTINDCVVGYKAQGNVVLNFANAMAVNFYVVNSTFYSEDKTTAGSNFIALSGKRPWQIKGYEEETGLFVCSFNTFANIAYKKQFMNTNTLKGQAKYIYAVANNIFFNTSNKKIYGNMTNSSAGAKQLVAVNNVYLWDDSFFAETNMNGDEGVQIDPEFKAPEEGNFRPTNFAFLNQETIPGDPRWTQWVIKK